MAVPPIIPWEPCNIPDEIQAELNRRKVNRSFRYVDGAKGEWDSQTGEWTKYRGPMSPWVRLCSNGAGKNYGTPEKPEYSKSGFVFFGGKGFYNEYGFGKKSSEDSATRSIIGYLPDGQTPHIIQNDLKTSNYPIHVPPPEIEKISCTIQKELFRRASIEWVCFSKSQLEYMTPYFLVPGISCILEFGWNLFNSNVLLNLTDIKSLIDYNNNPYPLYTERILESKGNYDVLFGRITHFEWEVEGNKFKCKTEITSQDRIYAGLIVNSKVEINSKDDNDEKPINAFGGLTEFIEKSMDKFRSIATVNDPFEIELIGGPGGIVEYVREHHKTNADEYLYGVFYGRGPALEENAATTPRKSTLTELEFGYLDPSAPSGPVDLSGPVPTWDMYSNKKDDFDHQSQSEHLWLNLGLVIECINLHHRMLKAFDPKVEIFRIDIDDVMITAHPNLISCNGNVLLIPNANAPKYHQGRYAIKNESVKIAKKISKEIEREKKEILELKLKHVKNSREKFGPGTGLVRSQNSWPTSTDEDFFRLTKRFADLPKKEKERQLEEENKLLSKDYADMRNASTFTQGDIKRSDAVKKNRLADYRLFKLCAQFGGVYRDNLDELINRVRFENTIQRHGDNAFPLIRPITVKDGHKPYPANFSGYLKDLYINVTYLGKLVKRDDIKNYFQLIETMMADISSAAGDFWDFRLVAGTGKKDQKEGEPATMKIVDHKFVNTVNPGTPFTFDYFDAESLLMGLQFKPTLSNAQAIRTIYAQTNQPDKNVVITNGNNELLDYKFKDRLAMKEENTPPKIQATQDESHAETMRALQDKTGDKTGDKNMFQMTIKLGGKEHIRRLVLPRKEILEMLLDDGDEENNPKYTGIMPGIQAQFTIQGIGGLRTFMMFLVRNLPSPYSDKDIIFRIVDIQDVIESGKWITTITAGVIPLRNHIRQRLGIPIIESS